MLFDFPRRIGSFLERAFTPWHQPTTWTHRTARRDVVSWADLTRFRREQHLELMRCLKNVTINGLNDKVGFCGEPTSFRVNLGELGPNNCYMKLLIEVTGPEHVEIHHEVKDEGRIINFVYRINLAGIYSFKMKYNGIPLPNSPLQVIVKKREIVRPLSNREIAAKTVLAHGRGLRKASLGEIACFKINTRQVSKTGDGPILIFIDMPDGTTISPLTCEPGVFGAKVAYISKQEGQLVVRILWDGVPICGSPFFVRCTKSVHTNRYYVRNDNTSRMQLYDTPDHIQLRCKAALLHPFMS